ncbi:hypothetical protein E1264_10445 [Actinomadura sp. KC216]|uniref:hypothetical protein n=1 Tax=Actinomadura sp. KC216 TaxID=2530370 RepID=UPI001043F83D|nr:hypothetical protein [Actinomadura sp. KC216]TDB88732.1 hypothetical protein E1264_10445 [Actinomadura sp. KC216]
MSRDIRVGLYGSGRTAGELVAALKKTGYRLTAAVVHSPRRAGQDIGVLTGGDRIGLATVSDLARAVRSGRFDVLLYAGLAGERHQEAMALCAAAGVHMVHACFVHPLIAVDEELRGRLSELAMSSGSRIVGTGMIPGLWLDVLPALLASALPAPVRIRGRRASDISSWGSDVLVHELGVGSRLAGTATRIDLLLRESAHIIADALRLAGDRVESRGGLAMASSDTVVGGVEVRAGEVEGFDQEVVVYENGAERIRLTWSGFAARTARGTAQGSDGGVELQLLGADQSEIAVHVAAPLDPYPGTAARMVSAIGGLPALPPGLHPTTALPVG